jgi:hypothetical protein
MEEYSSATEGQISRFYRSLGERDRRRYAAVEAGRLGHGGIEYIARVLGCDAKTIARGIVELESGEELAISGPTFNLNDQSDSETSEGELFVEAEIDNPLPYLGQQINYIFRIYQPLRFVGRLRYDPPAFTGFWHSQDPLQNEDIVERDGQTYQVTELQTILFPTRVGAHEIESVILRVASRSFTGDALQTEAMPVDVKPLPEPAPDTFSGAVGDYQIEAEVDITETAVDEAISWLVTIQGQGNIDTLPGPSWPDLSGWRAFEQPSSDQTEIIQGQLIGSRTFRRTLVPIEAGQFELPAITYTYFDPASETYQTIATDPIPISVAPGVVVPTTVPVSEPKQTLERLATDIRHIKAAPLELQGQPLLLTEYGIYWLGWLVPVVLFVGQSVWHRRRRWRAANRTQLRSGQAHKRALQALTQARKHSPDPYQTSNDILVTYITEKLNQPVAGLTHTALTDLLITHGLQPTEAQRVKACLAKSETGRFAPLLNGVEGRELLAETKIVINNMEAALKPAQARQKNGRH